jgi:DNA repair protein RadC
MHGGMAISSVDLEAWPIEDLLAAIMTAGACGAAVRRGVPSTARDIALDLLADLGGVAGLGRSTIPELEARLAGASPRLKPAACARGIASAFELGRRFANDGPACRAITNSADVAAWAIPRLVPLDHEELWLLALDGRSHVRAIRCVAKGGLHGMGVRPADPLRIALRAAASGFVLVHNHPSGDPAPSPEDVAFTRRVAAAAAVVGVPLLDHVVVGREGFASVPFPAEPGDASLASLSSLGSLGSLAGDA